MSGSRNFVAGRSGGGKSRDAELEMCHLLIEHHGTELLKALRRMNKIQPASSKDEQDAQNLMMGMAALCSQIRRDE